jgi:hypothetical protein
MTPWLAALDRRRRRGGRMIDRSHRRRRSAAAAPARAGRAASRRRNASPTIKPFKIIDYQNRSPEAAAPCGIFEKLLGTMPSVKKSIVSLATMTGQDGRVSL